MKSLRRSYWYITSYARKHVKLFVGATIAGVTLFAVVLPLLTKLPQIKRTTYIGVVGNYSFSTLPLHIQKQVSKGLTGISEDGSPMPDAALDWRVEDDGKTYIFTLKDNLRWQDGKILEATDVSYNFQDTEIITTPTEITFKLQDAFAPFPVVVSQPLFREVKTPYLRFFQRKRIVGLGKYEITKVSYKENNLEEMVLDSAQDRIIYRFYLTENRAKIAFQRGNIDVIQDLTRVHEFTDWPNTTISPTLHSDRYIGIFFNHDDPLFQKNIRQAFAYAIQKEESEERAKGPINPMSWAFLEGVKSYSFDQQRAIDRILDEVPQNPLQFSLTTTADFQREAEEIKRQWEELGLLTETACMQKSEIKDKAVCNNVKIQVNVIVTSYPDINNYQAMLIGQQIPSDPDQYSLWHSTQNTNFTRYQSPRIDVLLENGRKTTDQTERKALYQEFQQFLLEDSPVIFLKHPTTYTIERN